VDERTTVPPSDTRVTYFLPPSMVAVQAAAALHGGMVHSGAVVGKTILKLFFFVFNDFYGFMFFFRF